MRTAGEIMHAECKISIFNWNQKYLLKFERGPLEQTFKIDEFEFDGVHQLKAALTEEFIQRVVERFHSMESDIVLLKPTEPESR